MSTCGRCGKPTSGYRFCFTCNKLPKVYIDRKGYKRFIDTDRPIHQVQAERKIGRPLRKGEEVHHFNRDKTDNRMSNLHVLTREQHRRIHKIDAERFGKEASYQGFRKKRRGLLDGLFG